MDAEQEIAPTPERKTELLKHHVQFIDDFNELDHIHRPAIKKERGVLKDVSPFKTLAGKQAELASG